MERARSPHNIYVSVLDARRQDAYMGVFDDDGARIEEDSFLTVTEDCLDRFVSNSREIVICGEGTAKWSTFQGRRGFRILPLECEAENLVQRALLAFKKGEFEELSDCVPKYLKPPHITISS
jgi:tRNA A37 threonylcarbamoyladenosine modification protein TsaB